MNTAQPAPAPPHRVYISFSAEISPQTTESLLRACADLCNSGTQEIYLLLSTPGGSVQHGINIFNVLRALPCKIITHNVGAVDSIGNVVFLAGDERYSNPGATFMFHGVGFDVAQFRFDERLLVERLDSIRADQQKIADIIRRRARFADEEIEALFLAAATKDAEFAKQRGIIDEVREAKLEPGAPILQLVFER